MAKQLAVSAVSQAARICNQSESVSAFSRTLPSRAEQRVLPRENEAEGEIARASAGVKRVMYAQQQGEP